MSLEADPTIPAPAERPITLAFHKLQSRFSYSATNFSPRRFRRLLDFLLQRGYGLWNMSDSSPRGGRGTVQITFDDGYRHLLDNLPDVMRSFAFSPIVFVPTAWLGRPNRWDYSAVLQKIEHLSASEIRDLAAAGVNFGSHGHSHVALPSCSPPQLDREVLDSAAILTDLTGTPVQRISYPFGRCTRSVIEAVGRAGYTEAYTMMLPLPDDHNLSLGRIAVYGYDSLFSIRQKIEGGRLYWLEKAKARITNRLSGGTILLNRFRSKSLAN